MKQIAITLLIVWINISFTLSQSCPEIEMFSSIPSNDFFGQSVDMDGNNFIVGAPEGIINGVSHGVAYVYLWNGVDWDEHILTPSNGLSGDKFGYDVGIDGNRVIVGAYHNDAAASFAGSAYIYDYDGTTWTETIINSSLGHANAGFGWSVDVSGNNAVVGAPFDELSGGLDSGLGFIFEKIGSVWTEVLISDYGHYNEYIGDNVSIEGNKCIVGHDNSDLSAWTGYALYTKSGGTWNVQWIGNQLFEELILDSDVSGNLIALGGYNKAFTYCSGGSCSLLESELTPSDAPVTNGFGSSIAISGEKVIVGAPDDNTISSNNGAVYLFEFDSHTNTWTDTKFMASNPNSNLTFGSKVAISNDLFIGTSPISSGGAYLFDCNAIESKFKSTWQTTSANESITIPTTGGGYDYTIDWGDGTAENTNVTGDISHVYAAAGFYQITISGDFPRIYFNNSGDKDKIISINSWGLIEWTNMTNAFFGCSQLNILANDSPDLSNVQFLNGMFRDCIVMDKDISNWDVSNITHVSNMFRGATLFNQDLSTWNTSNFEKLISTFASASSFDQDLSNWDMSNANDMSNMFNNVSLSTINYDAFLTSLNSNPNILSNVIFSGGGSKFCQAASDRMELIENHNWQISDGGYISTCLSAPFVTKWNVGLGQTITIPTFGSGYDYLIEWGDGNYDVEVTGSISHTYTNSGIYTISIYGDFPRIFFNDSGNKDKIISIEAWGDIEWSNMENAFKGCSNLQVMASDAPNLNQVNSMISMFQDCTTFNENINHWDVGNVSRMDYLFAGCSNFNKPLNLWDVNIASEMEGMFQGCLDFNQSLNNWDVSSVLGMSRMFENCWSYNQPMHDWNVFQVADMSNMFNNASKFNSNLDNWNFESVLNMTDMLLDTNFADENYDNMLLSMEVQALKSNVVFGVGLTNYCLGESARANIINNFNWTIYDGGYDCGFITTWQTTSLGESITIPIQYGDFDVEWGDGAKTFNHDGPITHVYQYPGTYQVRIIGDVTSIKFNNSGDKDKIISIDEWGGTEWYTFTSAFKGCTNLNILATDAPKLNTGLTSFVSMFEGATSMNAPLNHWELIKVRRMEKMFKNATSFNQPLDTWNTSKVTRMDGMFEGATSFDQDISNWDFSRVQNMTGAFDNSGLSRTNYDKLLNHLYCQGDILNGVALGASNINHCFSGGAKQLLIDEYSWIISDSGISPSCIDSSYQLSWTGSINDDWFDCSNWSSNAIPYDNCDVTIPVATHYPVINPGDNIKIKTFIVSPTAVFHIPTNAIFYVDP